MSGQLFADGDLTPDGFFALPGEGDEVERPTSPTMTTREVAEWLGISERSIGVAARKHEIRRTSPGLYLTSSVVRLRHVSEVCSTAQMLSVLGVSPSWWQVNGSRLKVTGSPIAGIPRWHSESVNRLAVALRAGTGATA